MVTNPIGHKVHKINKVGFCFFRADFSKTYEIVEVAERGETFSDGTKNDKYCSQYLIRNVEDSNDTCIVDEFFVVYCPDYSVPRNDMIRKYLSDNGVYPDDVSTSGYGGESVEVSINWGDWKHDHAFADELMGRIACEFQGRGA